MPPADAAAAFIQGGEIAVEVARVTASGRDLTAGRRDLAYGFGIAGHVRHDHQDVVAFRVGQVLGGTGACGGCRWTGLGGHPLTGMVEVPVAGGPPSSGSPRPLQTRPSQSAPTGMCSGRPANRTRIPPGAIPPGLS